jgi:N-acetyl-gamma-glutamyl-phosphate reductase/acetylglutamate kinase
VLASLVLSASAQGQGMEAALWRRLREDFPALAWRARASKGPAAGRAEVLAGGPAAIPKAFPALSTSRAAQWAEGTALLPGGGGAQGMWWGLQGGKGVAEAIEALAAGGAPPAAAPPAAAAAGAAGVRRSPSIRVGLLGARGFVGRELLALIGNTSSLQVVCASSRALVGQPVGAALGATSSTACTPGLEFSDIGPKELASGAHPPVDVWVLALPNGHAEVNSAAIEARAKATGTPVPLMLDLSADMRFQARGGEWVYGFPEAPGGREALRRARKISNPGCYATGAQTAILPLLAARQRQAATALRWEEGCRPHVFGVSGYSGAGTTPSDKNDPARLRCVY